jgi:hypothetical protein
MTFDQSSDARTSPGLSQFGLALRAGREAERLFLIIPDAPAGFPIDEANPRASRADHRFVACSVILGRRLVRAPTLYFQARGGASIDKQP